MADYRTELPRDVVSITKPKKTYHRRLWILVAARDEDCDLSLVEIGVDGEIECVDGEQWVAYSELWERIGWLAKARKSTWILTFRSRHVLAKSKWIEALQNGEIELERQRKLAGKQAGVGKVCLSHGFTELDLRVCGRRVKLLDWQNFGVTAEAYCEGNTSTAAYEYLQIFSDWIKTYSLLGLSASRSSAAQVGWAKMRQSMESANLYTSLDPDIRALERRCYYGGRCEPFSLGDINRKVYLVDVRAAYASVCKDASLPIQPLRYYPDGVEREAVDCGGLKKWAADIVVNTDYPCYPVRHNGKVIYPTGRFATSLCGAELEHAIASGRVEKITRAVSYAALPILSRYAQWYFDGREKIAEAELSAQIGGIKAMFNASLGFLARQGREWSDWSIPGSSPWWFGVTNDPDDYGSIVRAHVLDSSPELLRVGSEPRNCSPIVHAAICAEARIMLANLITLAGRRNVYYCDTDGMIVNDEGLMSLQSTLGIFGPGYGQLSVRHEADRCSINGQKSYKIGDKVVCAGLPAANHDNWKLVGVSLCSTGFVFPDGSIRPFAMQCEDVGDETARWKNTII